MSKKIAYGLLGFIVLSGIVLFQRYQTVMTVIFDDKDRDASSSSTTVMMWNDVPLTIMSAEPTRSVRTTTITAKRNIVTISETNNKTDLRDSKKSSLLSLSSSSSSSSILYHDNDANHIDNDNQQQQQQQHIDVEKHTDDHVTLVKDYDEKEEDISSIDYFSCCGLGHRLTKNTDAYFIAKLHRYGLRFHWGFCADTVDVAHYLFGPINASISSSSSSKHNDKMTQFLQMKRKQYNKDNTSTNTISETNNDNTNTTTTTTRSILQLPPPPPRHYQIRINNEVPGFRKLVREGPKQPQQEQQTTNNHIFLPSSVSSSPPSSVSTSSCTCHDDVYAMKLESDIEFYTHLRDEQFRFRPAVTQFRRHHKMHQHHVLGMHIRGGNNETGQFGNKNRSIQNLTEWTTHMVDIVTRLWNTTVQQHEQEQRLKMNDTRTTSLLPPMLYLATDTPSLVTTIRLALQDIMPVIDLPQQRVSEGTGVAFGQNVHDAVAGGTDHTQDRTATLDHCLESWRSALMDMILLSHSDMVIAARPSSFVQSMPMMMAFANSRPYCEVNYNATDVRCFTSFQQWCCQGIGSFAYGNIKQRYEYIRIPYERLWTQPLPILPRRIPKKNNHNHNNNHNNNTSSSSSSSSSSCEFRHGFKSQCLPYHWPSQRELEQKHEMLYNQ